MLPPPSRKIEDFVSQSLRIALAGGTWQFRLDICTPSGKEPVGAFIRPLSSLGIPADFEDVLYGWKVQKDSGDPKIIRPQTTDSCRASHFAISSPSLADHLIDSSIAS